MAVFSHNQRLVPKKLLASTIGFLQSCCLALPSGRIHLIDLYSDLNSTPGWNSRIKIKLSHRSYKELRHFWQNPTPVGRSWFPLEVSSVVKLHLTTDAS